MQEKLHSNSDSFSDNNIEKKQAFLLKLSDTLRPLANPGEIEAAVTKIALDFMDADWCHYSTIVEDKLIILRDAVRGDLPSLVGEYKISSFALFKAVLDSGHPFIVDDVHTTEILDEELKQLCVHYQNISFINVPVVKNGKPGGMLSLIQSRPRKWTDFEVQLTIETAERTWAAVERAKAEEALRKSEEKYRTLFNSIDAGFCILEVFFNENELPYDYRFLEANDAFEKQTGLVDAVGKTMNEMVHGHEQYWFDIYGRIAKTGKSERFENEAKALGIYYEVYAFPVGEPEENRVGVLFNNITKRKQAEEKLKESESRFRTMADASPVLIWTIDEDGLSSYYNKTFRDFIGVSQDEDISDWAKIVHPEDLQFTFDTINTAMAERRSYSLELRLLRADGQWRWVLAQGNPNVGVNNEFLGFVGSSVDITERKETEVKIKESEHRFHQMIFSSPSMIAILKGEDFIIEVANDAILDELGKGKDIIGLPYLKAVPELEEQGFGELLRQVYKTGIPHQAHEMPGTLVHNGIEKTNYYNFIYQAQRNINNEILGIAIIATAVTTQAEFNFKIKESEQRFKNLVRETTVGIFVLTGENLEVEIVNEAYTRLINLRPEDLLGKPLFSVVPDAEDYYRPLLEKVRQTGETLYLYDSPYDVIINGNRIEVFVHVVLQPYRDTEGKTQGVMGIHQDVTEAVKSRKKIEESEKRFQAAISAVEGIIWTNNASGEMVGEQTGWSELTGQSFEEYQGFGWANAVHPDDAQPTLNAWNDAVKHKRTFVHEHRVKTINNALRLYSIKAVPVFNKTGAILQWVGVHTDITEQRADAQRIKESEERFRSLADQSPMIVYIVEPNPSATMSYFNETWLNYTGQNFEEALGRTWDGIVHPDDLQTVFDIYVPAFEARQSYTLPAVRLKRFDGEYRWHMFKGNPRHLANNEFNGFVGVGFDIHEQKVAEEKLAYRTALLEAHNHASGDGILLIDAKGKIISFNRRFVEIWNIPKHIVNAKDDEAVLSFAMTQLVTPQLFIDRIKRHCEHQTETVLDELEFKDGKIIEMNGYSVIGEDAKYYAWSWTFRDITLQRNYEKAIIESEKLLEQKVIERTEQLEEKNIELQNMNKELEAFTYVSSHDLQEPLRKIQTFAGRIIATEKEHLSENAKDYFGRMQNSATRMQALIQDLLAFSRVSTSERKFEIADLEKIVDEVKEEFKESIEEKKASVTTGKMCEVNIIPFQFRQLMHNLISNALKFSKQDVPSVIMIESKIVSGSDSPLGSRKTCHITVVDNGIGFEKEFSEKIFEVFQKLHAKEKYAGTGIGLAIVKKIVDNHNGMVTTESELGEGTRFNIYIPA